MPACWARSLGGCAAKISREHIVSAALWDGPNITVVGLPWCKDAAKPIGLSSLTAKILCRDHNTALSDVDKSAAASFRALQRSIDLEADRGKQRPRKWKIRRFEIDGKRLERVSKNAH